MPNPLIKGGPANVSREQDTDRKPLKPQVESYEGTNIPYRGVMYHGVEPTEKPRRPEGFGGAVEADYEPEVPEQQAIPVRVVNQSDRYFSTARADTRTLPAGAVINVVSRDDTRVSLKIINTSDAETVYIGFTQDMVPWNNSYPLMPGKDVTLVSQDDVFAYTTAADVIIGWLAEYQLPM